MRGVGRVRQPNPMILRQAKKIRPNRLFGVTAGCPLATAHHRSIWQRPPRFPTWRSRTPRNRCIAPPPAGFTPPADIRPNHQVVALGRCCLTRTGFGIPTDSWRPSRRRSTPKATGLKVLARHRLSAAASGCSSSKRTSRRRSGSSSNSSIRRLTAFQA